MTGENIICFAKDWAEDPTSNNHVMRQLARGNRVLWLNSISTRTPSLASGRDLKKIALKLASFMRGAVRVDEQLWVYTPIVLPLPHSRLAAALNRGILRATLRMLRRKLGMDEFQLWTFLPNVVDYVGKLDESLVVYYCVDEWSQFSYVDGAKIAAAEERLCRRADVVFATAQSLVEKRRAWNPNTFLASHGVDHALFAAALSEATTAPADLAALPQPVLGFYGTIQDWVDLKLIAYLAERHPEWSFAMIGKTSVDTEGFSKYPNVHFLGRKEHSTLPAYCKGFAVGLIPYILNERIMHVNPIKLREYLSAGLPVVSTAVPEVANYGEFCHLAADYEEFEHSVEIALRDDTPERRQQRSDAMRAETWERKVAEVGARVMEVKGRLSGVQAFGRSGSAKSMKGLPIADPERPNA
jgi:glycosyltransferase involved in cell wall biosynthesis